MCSPHGVCSAVTDQYRKSYSPVTKREGQLELCEGAPFEHLGDVGHFDRLIHLVAFDHDPRFGTGRELGVRGFVSVLGESRTQSREDSGALRSAGTSNRSVCRGFFSMREVEDFRKEICALLQDEVARWGRHHGRRIRFLSKPFNDSLSPTRVKSCCGLESDSTVSRLGFNRIWAGPTPTSGEPLIES